MREFTPRSMQVPIIDWCLLNRFCAVWADMGIGKTSAMLFVLSILKLINHGPALIVAPKYVAKFTWPDEIKKWDMSAGLTVSCIIGDAKTRLAALNVKADIYCINFENVQWLRVNCPKSLQFAKVIIDESTKIKSYRRSGGSKRARALFHMCKNVKYLYELTGTPGGNGLLDLWAQLYFLDLGKRLGTTFGAFKDRWFNEIRPENAQFSITKPKDNSLSEITNIVSDICLSVKAEDYFPVDKVNRVEVPVVLSDKLMKKYDEFHKDMLLKLDGAEDIRALSKAALTTKCLQIASGFIYTNEEATEYDILHDEKLDALESIVEEAAGEPLLIAYHFKPDPVRILQRFPSFRLWDGKESTIRRWNNGELPGLLAHPASMGHGLNLQDGGRRIIFFSHWWNREEKQQIIERIGPLRQMQSGHPRTVFQYDIVARDTVDENVIYSHEAKTSMEDALRRGTSRNVRSLL